MALFVSVLTFGKAESLAFSFLSAKAVVSNSADFLAVLVHLCPEEEEEETEVELPW